MNVPIVPRMPFIPPGEWFPRVGDRVRTKKTFGRDSAGTVEYIYPIQRTITVKLDVNGVTYQRWRIEHFEPLPKEDGK